jgi:pantothenate synthetase
LARCASVRWALRAKAVELFRALESGRECAEHGVRVVVDEVTAKLVLGFPPYLEVAQEGPQFSVDYVDVVDPGTFERVESIEPDSLIIAAVRLGPTRLIDNLPVGEAAARKVGSAPAAEPDAGEEG